MILQTTVRYSCGSCGLAHQPCVVPARGDEDVIERMGQTMAYVSRDHRARRPDCTAETADVEVPLEGTDRIGGPRKQ